MSGYVTVQEADEYIRCHYLSTDRSRLAWEELEDADKEILLRNSAEAINSLPFTGRKMYPTQDNAFPRFPSNLVPEAVKAAQIENALTSSDESANEDAMLYQRMKAYGVSSYSIGNLSETMVSAASSGGVGISLLSSGIVSTKAQSLLEQFLRGGYCIE